LFLPFYKKESGKTRQEKQKKTKKYSLRHFIEQVTCILLTISAHIRLY
jgi:hypothetical protein